MDLAVCVCCISEEKIPREGKGRVSAILILDIELGYPGQFSSSVVQLGWLAGPKLKDFQTIDELCKNKGEGQLGGSTSVL